MFFVSFFALINSLIIIPLTGGDNIIFSSIPIRIYPSQILLSLSKVQMKKNLIEVLINRESRYMKLRSGLYFY